MKYLSPRKTSTCITCNYKPPIIFSYLACMPFDRLVRRRTSLRERAQSVPPSIAQYSGNAICSVLVIERDRGVTTIGSDRGENYNFSNGQEINHKAWNEGEKRIRRVAIPSSLTHSSWKLIHSLQTYKGTQWSNKKNIGKNWYSLILHGPLSSWVWHAQATPPPTW